MMLYYLLTLVVRLYLIALDIIIESINNVIIVYRRLVRSR